VGVRKDFYLYLYLYVSVEWVGNFALRGLPNFGNDCRWLYVANRISLIVALGYENVKLGMAIAIC